MPATATPSNVGVDPAGTGNNMTAAPTAATSSPAPTITPSANPSVIKPPTSDIQTQISGLQSTIAAKQSQADAITKAGYAPTDTPKYDAQGNLVPKTQVPPDDSSLLDSIVQNNQQTQQKISTAQANEKTAVANAQQGLQPQLDAMNALSAQIETVNGQLADMKTAEQNAINAISDNPNVSIELQTQNQKRIERDYAVQESGLSATAAALGTQLSTMQNNFTQATALAKMAIDSANTQYSQTVSDLEWANTQFSDTIKLMDTDQQQAWNDAMTVAKQQSDDNNAKLTAIGNMATDPQTAGAFQGVDWTKLSQADADALVAKYVTSPAYFNNLARIKDANTAPSSVNTNPLSPTDVQQFQADYPDAGIKMGDTYASAYAKINGSGTNAQANFTGATVSGLTVTTTDGHTLTFKDQTSLNSFMKDQGISSTPTPTSPSSNPSTGLIGGLIGKLFGVNNKPVTPPAKPTQSKPNIFTQGFK